MLKSWQWQWITLINWGFVKLRLVINSIGDKETRAAYRQALIDYLEPFEAELSEDSRRRLHENPLRVLDSKDKKDKPIVVMRLAFWIILVNRLKNILML